MHLYSLSHKQQQGQFVNHHTAWDTVLQRLMSHLATDYLLENSKQIIQQLIFHNSVKFAYVAIFFCTPISFFFRFRFQFEIFETINLVVLTLIKKNDIFND